MESKLKEEIGKLMKMLEEEKLLDLRLRKITNQSNFHK